MGNNNPLVSIIVTTYNRKEFLLQTIKSILAQTYTNFELIIIDNYSNYDIISYLKLLSDKRIKLIQNNNNGIIAINRNIGIKTAKGEFIAFCDDDDLWDDHKLSIQFAFFEKNVVGVGSGAKIIGDNTYFKKDNYYKKRSTKIFSDISIYDLFVNHNLLLSSLLIRNNGVLFDESPDVMCIEDFVFQIKLLSHKNTYLREIQKPLIYYRIHSSNGSLEINSMRKILTCVDLYKTYFDIDSFNNILSKHNFNLGLILLRSGDVNARKYFRNSLQYNINIRSFLGYIFSLIPRIIRMNILKIYYLYR